MDLERCFSKKNWAKAYKVCIYMEESLPESRGPKNSEKVASIRVLCDFKSFYGYFSLFDVVLGHYTLLTPYFFLGTRANT